MSAAATAAGYLYASGRLRGRNAREQDDSHKDKPAAREKIRVAVMPEQQEQAQPPEKPKRTPKIEYRRRRLVTPE